eukprot:6858926-Pyramimonas_sp.AAC.1
MELPRKAAKGTDIIALMNANLAKKNNQADKIQKESAGDVFKATNMLYSIAEKTMSSINKGP